MKQPIIINEKKKFVFIFKHKDLHRAIARGIFYGFMAIFLFVLMILKAFDGNFWGWLFDFVVLILILYAL